MALAETILASLTQPSTTLVFCDDTAISGTQVAGLVPDIQIWSGIVLSSEKYVGVTAQMQERLTLLGQPEFHATEIVNPKNGSGWKSATFEQRVAAMELLRDLATTSIDKMYYIHIASSQFAELKEQAKQLGVVSVGHKAGLKRVFLRCLLPRLSGMSGRTVVVLDRLSASNVASIENYEEGAFLEGGGPISANSHAVLGLQLADVVAFSISRYLQVKHKIAQDIAKPFDILVAEIIAGLEGRVDHLLNQAK